MVRQAGVMDGEAQSLQHLCNQHRSGLLPVHSNRKSLCSTQQEEGVKWSQRIPNRVDGERHLLEVPRQKSGFYSSVRLTFARSSRLQVITPAIKS